MRAFGWVVAALVVGLSCSPVTHPVLELTVSPMTAVGAMPVRVRVVGKNAAGKVGVGIVTLKSTAGSLTTPVEVELDHYGTATADLVCDARTDSACAEKVTVTGTWNSDKEQTSAEAILRPAGMSGAGGGGGGVFIGSDGGRGGGGGAAASGRTFRPISLCSFSVFPNYPPTCCWLAPFSSPPCLGLENAASFRANFIDPTTSQRSEVTLTARVDEHAETALCSAAQYGLQMEDGGWVLPTTDDLKLFEPQKMPTFVGSFAGRQGVHPRSLGATQCSNLTLGPIGVNITEIQVVGPNGRVLDYAPATGEPTIITLFVDSR